MSNKTIAWIFVIAVVVMIAVCGIASTNGKINEVNKTKNTYYSSKCSWCGKNTRMPNKSVCKDCNELAELMIKYNK